MTPLANLTMDSMDSISIMTRSIRYPRSKLHRALSMTLLGITKGTTLWCSLALCLPSPSSSPLRTKSSFSSENNIKIKFTGEIWGGSCASPDLEISTDKWISGTCKSRKKLGLASPTQLHTAFGRLTIEKSSQPLWLLDSESTTATKYTHTQESSCIGLTTMILSFMRPFGSRTTSSLRKMQGDWVLEEGVHKLKSSQSSSHSQPLSTLTQWPAITRSPRRTRLQSWLQVSTPLKTSQKRNGETRTMSQNSKHDEP